MTNAKPYVLVVTLSTQDDVRLLQQLKSGFKRTMNWNKYQSKTCSYNTRHWYLGKLFSSSFQEVNRLFV